MVYFPESFEESLKEFEKLIVKDPRYAVPKIKGQGSFSKFVRVCMLVYIKRRTEELMQEKEKKEKENKINTGAPSNAASNKNSNS